MGVPGLLRARLAGAARPELVRPVPLLLADPVPPPGRAAALGPAGPPGVSERHCEGWGRSPAAGSLCRNKEI